MASNGADVDERQGFRLYAIGIVAVCLVAALFARLWFLQVLESEELQDVAATNILRVVYTEAPRGPHLRRPGQDPRPTTAWSKW